MKIRGKRKAVYLIFLLISGMIILSACNQKKVETSSNTTDKTESVHLMIAAAASLETVFEEQLIPSYEADHPNVTIEGVYDSSGKLESQIKNGLDADLFFSAATMQMDELVADGYVTKKSVVPLLQNKLVLITPSNSETKVKKFSDLTKAKSIAVGDPNSVPAGQYAKEGLTSLGIWNEIQPSISFGTNVTEVLNWVIQDSAEVGIVYATDAALSNKVKVVDVMDQDTLGESIIYPIGLLKNSTHQKEAEAFMTYLKSNEAKKKFQDVGFQFN